jgi:hypothetical protein
MTYDEFEKSLVVEPTYRFMTDDITAVKLTFQENVRANLPDFEARNEEMTECVIGCLARSFYERLFGLYTLVEEFDMTEDEFVRWCRHKFYSEKAGVLV